MIVPSRTYGKNCGYSAYVVKRLDDIITVRVPIFHMGRQQWLLKDIRKHPYRPTAAEAKAREKSE